LEHAATIRLSEAALDRFILFSRSVSSTYYDQLISVCAASGFHPVVRHEVRHWLTAVACVSYGLGVALVPASMREARVHGVVYLSLENSLPQPQLWVAWSAKDASNAALHAFHSAVKNEFQREAVSPPPLV